MMNRIFLIVSFAALTNLFAQPVIDPSGLTRIQSAQTAAADQKTPDPKVLLQGAVEACLKVKTIEYVFELETIHDNGPGFTLPQITATMRQARADVPRMTMPGKYAVSGVLTLPPGFPDAMREMHGMKPGQDKYDFAFAYDGTTFQILNLAEQSLLIAKQPELKTVVTLRDNAGLATVGNADFTGPEPLKRFLENNGDVKYVGTVEVDGVKCHFLTASTTLQSRTGGKGPTMNMRLYLGVDDLLPRRQVLGPLQTTTRILKVNQPLGDDVFTVKAPNGYSAQMITEAVVSNARSKGLLIAGDQAPDWKLRDAEGREHTLADYRGKVVVMDFWATWCGPCIMAMPSIQALHEKYSKQGVVVLGISTKESGDADPAGFMKSKGFTYQLLVHGETLVDAYHADGLPTLYIIGKDGRIIHSERGYNKEAKGELEHVVEAYLKDGSFKQVIERKK